MIIGLKNPILVFFTGRLRQVLLYIKMIYKYIWREIQESKIMAYIMAPRNKIYGEYNLKDNQTLSEPFNEIKVLIPSG